MRARARRCRRAPARCAPTMHATMRLLVRALRLRAGDLHRAGRDPPGVPAAAHAADVAHQRDLRDRRGRRDPGGRPRLPASRSAILGAIAVFASMTNIVSGFLITDRMLKMFKTRAEARRGPRPMIDALGPARVHRRDGAVRLRAALDERAGARRPQGRVRRRGRHGPRGPRHVGRPEVVHHLWIVVAIVAGLRGRCPALAGAAHRGAPADGALPRVRRPGRRPRRHRQVLPLVGEGSGAADAVPDDRAHRSRCCSVSSRSPAASWRPGSCRR